MTQDHNTNHDATNTPTGDQSSDEAGYRAEYTAAWETAVEAMTTAVRLKHPKFGPANFPEFLASALAAVAGNVGSSYLLIAGRPGSWEAAHVDNLVCGTVDPEDVYLAGHRTEPVVIPLDVRALMCQDTWERTQNYVTPYDTECEEIYERHAALPEAEYDPDVEDSEMDAVRARWAARYRAYADAFTTAVMAEALQVQGLRVPVTVEANTDPDEGTSEHPYNPDEIEDPDPLVYRLWDAAHHTVPLPGTEDTEQQGAAQ